MNLDLDVLIRQKETELKPLLQQMDEVRLQFVNDTANFVGEWFVEKAKEYATKKPEITMHLGKEKLFRMKAEVNSLAKNAGNFVNSTLSDPNLWWHKTPHVNAAVAAYEQFGNSKVGNKFPEVLDKAVRRALGELGNILEEFGYGVTTGTCRASYPEFWFECLDEPISSIRPFFPHLFEWSKEMQDSIMKYDTIYKKAILIFEEITQLKEGRKRQEANTLWTNA